MGLSDNLDIKLEHLNIPQWTYLIPMIKEIWLVMVHARDTGRFQSFQIILIWRRTSKWLAMNSNYLNGSYMIRVWGKATYRCFVPSPDLRLTYWSHGNTNVLHWRKLMLQYLQFAAVKHVLQCCSISYMYVHPIN